MAVNDCDDIIILNKFLKRYGLTDETCLSETKQAFFPIKVAKKNPLFLQNTPAKCHYFLPAGIIRYYVNDDGGREYTKAFRTGPTFIGSAYAINTRGAYPFSANIIAAKTMYAINVEEWISLIEKNVLFSNFYQKYLTDLFVEKEKRELDLLQNSAEYRYQVFTHDYQTYLSVIPQWMIASYLGITPEALSRLKKRLGKYAS